MIFLAFSGGNAIIFERFAGGNHERSYDLEIISSRGHRYGIAGKIT